LAQAAFRPKSYHRKKQQACQRKAMLLQPHHLASATHGPSTGKLLAEHQSSSIQRQAAVAAPEMGKNRAGKTSVKARGTAAAIASLPALVAMRRGRPARGVQRRAIAKEPSRGGKRVMSEVWFDLDLPLPLGIELKDAPDGTGCYVASLREGGSALEHNRLELLDLEEKERLKEQPQHWVQEVDFLRFVNGTRVTSVDEAVEKIQAAAAESDILKLGFARKWNRTVKVVFPGDKTEATADYNEPIAQAAAKANHLVKYQCNDGECGSCWHKDDRTDEVYVMCLEDCKVGFLPSKTAFNEDSGSIIWNEKAERERKDPKNSPYFDNTEPLILRECPEVYEEWKKANPLAAARADLTRNRLRGAFSGLAPGEENLGKEYFTQRPGLTVAEPPPDGGL